MTKTNEKENSNPLDNVDQVNKLIAGLNMIEISKLTKQLEDQFEIDTNSLLIGSGSAGNSAAAADDTPKTLHIMSCASGASLAKAIKGLKDMYTQTGQSEKANTKDTLALYKSIKEEGQAAVLDFVDVKQQDEIRKLLEEAGFVLELK